MGRGHDEVFSYLQCGELGIWHVRRKERWLDGSAWRVICIIHSLQLLYSISPNSHPPLELTSRQDFGALYDIFNGSTNLPEELGSQGCNRLSFSSDVYAFDDWSDSHPKGHDERFRRNGRCHVY